MPSSPFSRWDKVYVTKYKICGVMTCHIWKLHLQILDQACVCGGGGGGTPISWYTYVMQLSIDSPFFAPVCLQILAFSQPYTQWPLIFPFSVKLFEAKSSNFENCSENLTKTIVKIAQVLFNFAPIDPLFLDLLPNDPLFCKKIVSHSPLISCVGRRTPVTFTCESPHQALSYWQ